MPNGLARRGLANGLVVLVALLPATVQPLQQPPAFPTQAEIVTVDVVVLDRDGKPVAGLRQTDFRVLEDGREQAVAAFEAVEAIVPALSARETVAASPSAARVATNVAGPPTRRTFAIVFDDLHVGALNIEQAKRAVEAFVAAQAGPGDRLVLFTTSDARYWATTRGSDDAQWTEALRRLRSRERASDPVSIRMTHWEAIRIAAFGDEAVRDRVDRRRMLSVGCEPDLNAQGAACVGGAQCQGGRCLGLLALPGAEEVYARHNRQLDQTLRVLRAVTESLEPIRGRKALVLVSEGFVLDVSKAGFREVREQAARANVVVNFLDARGLPTGPEFLSAAGSRAALPARDVGPTLAAWRMEDDGAETLAQETGGLVLQTNDLVAGLERVADESRVTYLLGYEPTNAKRDGRYRKLKVEVLRPGLSVRARTGYFAAKGKEKPAPELSGVQRALRNPFDSDGIPLRLAGYVMGPAPLQSPVPKTGVEVLIAGEVRLDALETHTKDGRLVAEPKLTLVASSRSGESHESSWTLEIALGPSAERAEPGKAWHPFLTRIAMAPGDYRARLVVESGGRVGSVTTDFVVPDLTEERLSTPVLSDQLVSGPGVMRVMPVVRRSFPASSTLHVWLELEGAARDEGTGQPRATASFAVRSADGREWASGAATSMGLESGRPTRLVSIPLSEAPAGESEIVLTVRDGVSGRALEAREPFRVDGSPPAEAPSEPR